MGYSSPHFFLPIITTIDVIPLHYWLLKTHTTHHTTQNIVLNSKQFQHIECGVCEFTTCVNMIDFSHLSVEMWLLDSLHEWQRSSSNKISRLLFFRMSCAVVERRHISQNLRVLDFEKTWEFQIFVNTKLEVISEHKRTLCTRRRVLMSYPQKTGKRVNGKTGKRANGKTGKLETRENGRTGKR